MKILYFTSTGNCLAVAKRFDAEKLSIPQLLKNKQFKIKDYVIGIVYPVYRGGLPVIVKRYLQQCYLDAEYIFVIATYGNMAMGTLCEAKKALKMNNNHVDYYEKLLMVDNFLPFFDIKKQLAIKKNTDINLSKIIDEVNNHVKKEDKSGIGYTVLSSMLNVNDNSMKNTAIKLFYVSDDCIGCGVCKKVCPVANVTQKDNLKPIFNKECESCFACVHNCPKKAIHLKNEKSGERFRNAYVSLDEIIKANSIV